MSLKKAAASSKKIDSFFKKRQNDDVKAEAGPSDNQSTDYVPKVPEAPSLESTSVKSYYLPNYLHIG